MPRRPTSTPTPSPSRRMMNVMVTGQFRAYRLDEADQALLFSTLPPSAATSLKQAVTFKMGCFFCLRGTCYIYMSLSRRPCGLRAAVRSPATLYPRKREFPDPDPAGVRHKIKRSATELMPIDRRPEFFKGAQLKVGIIGCGYVGLPLALRFAEAGHKVTGFDTDPNKVTMLNAGKSYIEHIPQNKIQQFVNSKHFSATND